MELLCPPRIRALARMFVYSCFSDRTIFLDPLARTADILLPPAVWSCCWWQGKARQDRARAAANAGAEDEHEQLHAGVGEGRPLQVSGLPLYAPALFFPRTHTPTRVVLRCVFYVHFPIN